MLKISGQEHVLQKNTIAAQLEPIEIDMIEECGCCFTGRA
jgi:hypothetical protein